MQHLEQRIQEDKKGEKECSIGSAKIRQKCRSLGWAALCVSRERVRRREESNDKLLLLLLPHPCCNPNLNREKESNKTRREEYSQPTLLFLK